jgi:hypothetical protein
MIGMMRPDRGEGSQLLSLSLPGDPCCMYSDKERFVEGQLVAVPDGVTIHRVRNLEHLAVIHRQRPESIDRGQFSLCELEHVFVGAIERMALVVDRRQWI